MDRPLGLEALPPPAAATARPSHRYKPARLTRLQGALSFDAAPPEALLAGGAAVLLALAGIGYAAVQQQGGAQAAPAKAREPELPRENAVLVFGATGRMGRTVVNSVRAALCLVLCCRPCCASFRWC